MIEPADRLTVEQLDAAVELMGREGQGAVLPVRGESMLPTLSPGQSVVVDLSPFEPRLGDVLLYRQQDYLVVHRYLGPASRKDGAPLLRTRGDGLTGLDPALPRERVLGRVRAIEDQGRFWSLDGGGARAWALAVAAHDLFWAGAWVLAGRRSWLMRLDRRLLRLGHRLLFRALHRASDASPLDSSAS